ncbi:MAG TPA: hypothetical protein VFO79_06760 [Xanthomonadales bacterium]|nr:hypothetical protein [Xanthomonadales bacterium]
MSAPDRITFVTPFGELAFRTSGESCRGPAFFLYVQSGRRILFLGYTDDATADLRALGPWNAARRDGADCIYVAPFDATPERRLAIERWMIACFAPPLNATVQPPQPALTAAASR